MTSDQEAHLFETLGEIRATLKKLCSEFDAHVADHKSAVAKAEDAQKTAKAAALLTAIAHRDNRLQRWGIYVAVALGIAQMVLRLVGIGI